MTAACKKKDGCIETIKKTNGVYYVESHQELSIECLVAEIGFGTDESERAVQFAFSLCQITRY